MILIEHTHSQQPLQTLLFPNLVRLIHVHRKITAVGSCSFKRKKPQTTIFAKHFHNVVFGAQIKRITGIYKKWLLHVLKCCFV